MNAMRLVGQILAVFSDHRVRKEHNGRRETSSYFLGYFSPSD